MFEILDRTDNDALPEEPEMNHDPEVHPFDNPDLTEVFLETYGVSKDILDAAKRPGLSAEPEPKELGEAEMLRERMKRFPGEGAAPYARRILYEGVFAAVGAVTPGGLASHGYYQGYVDHKTIEQLAESKVYAPPSPDGLSQDDRRLLSQLGGMTANQEGIGFMYRTLHMLHIVPEMTEPANRELAGLFVPERRLEADQPVSRTELMFHAWGQGRSFFDANGYRPNIENDPEVIAATHNLALLRTHPDMQVFFEYLSPYAYDKRSLSVGESSPDAFEQ